MKEATGELNMTVIVLIAVAAVLALFWAFVWPAIQSGIKSRTCSTWKNSDGTSYKYVTNGTGDKAKKGCCPTSAWNATTCIEIDEEDAEVD